jgi:hypothetical protein
MKNGLLPTVAQKYGFFTFLRTAASSFTIVYLFAVQRHEPVNMVNLFGDVIYRKMITWNYPLTL